MAERPIIFGTWAIPKLLDGSKTQTRRTRGLEKINKNPDEWVQPYQLDVDPQLWTWRSTKTGEVITIKCPYGQVGDKLWVRETWFPFKGMAGDRIVYKADNDIQPEHPMCWQPSIHMFRRDSRIDLTITEIGAERLWEITEGDAIAEGCQVVSGQVTPCGDAVVFVSARYMFRSLWVSLNAKRYPWSFNPWEWPITFELVK